MELLRSNSLGITQSFHGDLSRLIDQIGMAAGLPHARGEPRDLSGGLPRDEATLAAFLDEYRVQVLQPVELPAVGQAYGHAAGHETRELLGLDRQLARHPGFRRLAGASRQVGRSRLRRLRPLRDVRTLQRYLRAVDGGRAHGWHMLVYGMILAIYSLPLRQGLLSYARQTLRGFTLVADARIQIGDARCRCLVEQVLERTRPHIDALPIMLASPRWPGKSLSAPPPRN